MGPWCYIKLRSSNLRWRAQIRSCEGVTSYLILSVKLNISSAGHSGEGVALRRRHSMEAEEGPPVNHTPRYGARFHGVSSSK
jgi:hypothetical protein